MIKILITISQRLRGVARSETEAKRYAEEDAVLQKAKEAARAAAAAANAAKMNHTNGNHDSPRSKLSSISCTPTLPESAVITPSAKGPRMEGQRNLQDSTFSISGTFNSKISKIHYFCSFYKS